MSVGVLGDITFEATNDRVLTFTDLTRSAPARWVAHDVHGQKPRQEFIGPGLDSISLTIRLDIERGVVPKDELARIRQARDEGKVLQFTIGGKLVGDYIIKDAHEELRRLNNGGVLLFAVVTLTLEEYR